MDKSILSDFRLTVAEQNLNVYGIVVKQEGKRVEQRFRSDDRVNIYSASKAVTALAIGMLQDAGSLKLSDTLLSYFPEYIGVSTPGSEEITVRDLLHMASGKLAFFGEFRSLDQDNLEAFFRHEVKSKPGEKFYYSNGCTYALSLLVERISGQTLRDFLVPRLFDILGIQNPQWFACPRGHTLGATGLFLTTEELSRIGEVFLGEGTYNGHHIVSPEFIKSCWSDSLHTKLPNASPNGREYGYQVWLGQVPGTYRLDGKYGQYSIIFPREKATITITAHEEHRDSDILKAVYETIWPQL
ncbi:MAG: beta-lactamase family protein [Turicibacter sp.]|nr:beta-lactamase family protein [Turicibacter sp.]